MISDPSDCEQTMDAPRSTVVKDETTPSVEAALDEVAVEAVRWQRVVPACLLGWAVPGLGHISQQRIGRGVLFAIVVFALFVGGISLEGRVYRPVEGEPLTYLAAVGAAGVGVAYIAAHMAGFGEGNLEGALYEYGNTFTLVAGLLNLLVVLDIYDIAAGRR